MPPQALAEARAFFWCQILPEAFAETYPLLHRALDPRGHVASDPAHGAPLFDDCRARVTAAGTADLARTPLGMTVTCMFTAVVGVP